MGGAKAASTELEQLQQVSKLPGVSLDKRYYALLPDFEARVPVVPSLVAARSLTVEGDWTFDTPVKVVGDAVLADSGEAASVPGGVLGSE